MTKADRDFMDERFKNLGDRIGELRTDFKDYCKSTNDRVNGMAEKLAVVASTKKNGTGKWQLFQNLFGKVV